MKKAVNYLTSTKAQIGIRLCMASIALVMGNVVAVALTLFLPMFAPMSAVLGITPEEAEKALLEKVKKESAEAINGFKKEFNDLANAAKSGMISKEDFDKKFGELSDKLKEFDAEKFKAFEATLADYKTKLDESTEAAKTLASDIKKMKEKGVADENVNPLRKKLQEIIGSEEFKTFVESGGKRKAEFEVKAVDITAGYTGASRVHITSRINRVVDHPPVERLNIRDLLTVASTDLPYLAFIEVYDWERNAGAHSENGSLAQSAFKVREATSDAKRIGTSLEISKRMLRSASYLESHIATRLPALVKYNEDFQILFGDGQGNNLTGIFKVADNFATVINNSIAVAAGEVDSVASYDGGAKALITFTKAFNINNGEVITIAGATNVGYNGAHNALVISPTQIVIEEAYVAEADTSAWTATVSSRFKNAIFAAQEIDVLKVAKTLVTRQEYACNGIVLHPDDATLIETLKGNDEHYIDVKRLENGVLTIAGVPVVETTAMPSGKFAVGDWAMAAALLEFTSLVLEFSESTNEKLKNTVMAIIQEEIIFPIYNKYMFVVGDFSTAKAAILKA